MERKSYTAAYKTKIVLELLRGERELNEIAAENEIAPNQLRNWKAEFLDNADIVFDRKRDKRMREELDAKQRESDQLAKKVGQLTLQVDRTSVYQKPSCPSDGEIAAKNLIDKLHTDHPAWGSRQLSKQMKSAGMRVGRLKTRRFMDEMGIEAIYPKPNLSKAAKMHPIYPYLLRNFTATRPNQVWSIDITYIRMKHGFIKGRWADNIPIERWFRTLKYEEIYLKDYESPKEARAEIGNFIYDYNFQRIHSALDTTPAYSYYPIQLYSMLTATDPAILDRTA